MKRYELKDNELQTALEKAFPGFGEALQAACENTFDDVTNYVEVPLDRCSSILFRNVIDIYKRAITTKEEYDPRKWNKFPEVKPPMGILMRAEGHYRYGGIFKGAAAWDNGVWLPLEPMTEPEDIMIDRFRPWDEDEE